MKAHIARNQNAGVPLALGWNLSPADRGKLEGMAPAFGMKLLPVAPADAGKTVAQLLGEVEVKAPAQGGGHPRKPQLDVCRPAGAFAGGAHRL